MNNHIQFARSRRTRGWLSQLCRFVVALLFVGLMGCADAGAVNTGVTNLLQAEADPALEAETAPPGIVPRTLARIRIAFDEETITDARADLRQGVIYVTDSGAQLHVLDIDTFVEIVTLPVGGQLTLDSDNNRLYAASDAGVAVIDTATRTILARLSGTHVAVDGANGRIYTGERLHVDTPTDAPGVRLYSSDTLDLIATGDQPGIPVYNPVRNELLLVAYTVYTADPETLAVRDDLLPELSEQSARWCNGCDIAQSAAVFPAEDLLAVEVIPLAVGGGSGTLPPPRFWSASTLEPDPAAEAIRSFQPLCSERRALRPVVNGRAYRSTIFQRYVTITNLSVYDEGGTLLDWRDGMGAGFINAGTGQAYTSDGFAQLRAVNLGALQPVVELPIACVLEHDPSSGRMYGAQGGDFYILAESGGEPPTLPPVEEPLPAVPVQDVVAPAAASENSPLFAVMPGSIYRSTDGGETWAQLRGGLPTDQGNDELTWTLALSPDFERDETIFVGGHRNTAWGEGVWQSRDGGDSWQPLWHGLTHLRIERIELSPNFAVDDTLLAYAQYDHLDAGDAGFSVFRSTDRGLHWTVASTATAASELPPANALLGTTTRSASSDSAPFVRVDPTGRGLERTEDGQTWQPVDVPGLLSQDSYVQAILSSPAAGDEPGALYVVAEYEVIRTPDDGVTWERWVDPRLEDLDYTSRMTTALLAGEQLIIGTADGQVWMLSPDTMAWQTVE